MVRFKQPLNGCFYIIMILAGLLALQIPTVSYAADEIPLHQEVFLKCMSDGVCKQKVDRACAQTSDKTEEGGLCRTREACGEDQRCLASLKQTLDGRLTGPCAKIYEAIPLQNCLRDTQKLTTINGNQMGIKEIAAANTWQVVSGAAFDVSVGGDGSIWHVGGNGSLYYKMPNDSNWTLVHKGSRAADRHIVQVEAQNKDRAFIRTKDNQMWIVATGKAWENVPGGASYIASNANNDLYHIGMDGKTVYRYEYNPKYKSFWHKMNGTIQQISAEPNGNVWGVGTNKAIYQRKSKSMNDTWHAYPGSSTQVSVSSTGNVWHIGGDSRTAYHLKLNSKVWDGINPAPEKLVDIAAGPHGELWGVGQSKKIYVVETKKQASISAR